MPGTALTEFTSNERNPNGQSEIMGIQFWNPSRDYGEESVPSGRRDDVDSRVRPDLGTRRRRNPAEHPLIDVGVGAVWSSFGRARRGENRRIAAREDNGSDPVRIASYVAVAVALVFLVHEIVDIILLLLMTTDRFGYLPPYVLVGDEALAYAFALGWAITAVVAAGFAALVAWLRARSARVQPTKRAPRRVWRNLRRGARPSPRR